jgi:hypothetical protein
MAPSEIKRGTSSRVSLSPTAARGVKRERTDHDGDQARRVNQRTGKEAAAPEQHKEEEKSMETLVLDDLNSADEDFLADTLYKLLVLLRRKNGELLGNLSRRQAEFIQLGGHATVVRVMNAHRECITIQENGAGVLANLCSYSNISAVETVGKVRGIQAVVEAMKAHPLERDVIHKGIVALLNLSSGNEVNATLLVTKLEAMPFIVKRANDFLGDEAMTKSYCCLLDSLSKFILLRNSLLYNAKAAPVLALAMTNYRDNASIQKSTRTALRNLIQQP